MKPEYLTREVTINRAGFETLVSRALADALFPTDASAKAISGAEFATLMNGVLTYMEDALFSRDEDKEA